MRIILMIAAVALANPAFAVYTVLNGARQTVYQNGVPHTNRNGVIRTVYIPNVSFFPRILYHPHVNNDMAGGTIGSNPTRFDLISAAGFNAIETTFDLNATLFSKLAEYNIQLNYCPATQTDASMWSAYRSQMLGWDIFDEPDANGIVALPAYNTIRTGIRQYDPITPCFVNTTSRIAPEPYTSWWIQWHQTSDISCHDNYPYTTWGNLWSPTKRPTSLSYATGIPETVSLAVNCTNQAKPVWLIVQAFSGDTPNISYFYPTGDELRAMVYAGIVHGAVGINFFAYDNYIVRNANLLGISPNPSASYGTGRVATADELNAIISLWNEAASINQELIDLEPWILSPTSSLNYTVYKEGTSITANPIRCILKSYKDQLRLIAVNIDRASLQVRFDFSSSGINLCNADRLYRNQAKINLSSNILQDSFAPMEVKVYRLYCYSLDDDRDVDYDDLMIFAENWLE